MRSPDRPCLFVLCKHPFHDSLLAHVVPDPMAGELVFGIFRVAAGFADRIDHIAGMRYRCRLVAGAMKCPYRHIDELWPIFGIAPAANRHRRRKHFGMGADKMPRAVAAAGNAQNINAFTIAGPILTIATAGISDMMQRSDKKKIVKE